MKTRFKKFYLRVYDNFHYGDESEAYDFGKYETYEEARKGAQAIVNDFLETNWKSGIDPAHLLTLFSLYGEDPIVLPNRHGDAESFSAQTYAREIAPEICKKLENKNMQTQTLYQEAIRFAAAKHMEKNQKVPGTDLPYVVHLSNVAMEIMVAGFNSDNFNLRFAVQVALLHDILEDTDTDFSELENKFGLQVAQGVSALTKNSDLPKEEQMKDSLARVKKMRTEVWAVKLADRITNLQAPPSTWDRKKKIQYKKEARIILNELKSGNIFLAKRLEAKIEEYEKYIKSHEKGIISADYSHLNESSTVI